MNYLFLLFGLTFSGLTYAATLAEIVDRKIDEKAMEAKAKETGAAQMSMNSPAIVTSAPKKSQHEITPDDIQIVGIIGVGENLKAKVIIKNAQPAAMMVGQSLQGGWVLASLTPNMAIFELRKPSKNKKQDSVVVARRQIMISGSSALNSQPSEGATFDMARAGTLPGISYVPALKPIK